MKRSIVPAVTLAIALGSTVLGSAGLGITGLGSTGIASAGTGLGRGSAVPQRMVDAVVVLTAQADLSRIRTPNRSARLAAVEGALRATAAGSQRGVLALLRARQAQHLVNRITPLWIVNEVGVRAAPSVITELAARADVRAIRPDLEIQAPAPSVVTGSSASTAGPPEDNVARINAPALWDRGYRGQGTVVATMDTGVDVSHPDLAGRWRGGNNSWFDPNGQHPSTPTDVNGHGTQTMGVIVGGDSGGTSVGVAPDATWIAVKIFNDRGSASSTTIHSGFQWLLDPDGNPATADAPNVVNNSWTMSAGGCYLDFQLDLRNLRAAGILPVFSAGNYGPTAGTVLSPANLPEAFAVGGTDDADVLDPYSSRGPSACAQSVAPRLAAPGVGIHTTDLYGSYVDATGTSLAAPHVAGALALLLSAFPGLPADRQEAALQAGAVDLGPTGVDNDYGYGRLDALAAYQWLAAAPDYGVAASPSSATTTPGGTVSYTVSVSGANGFTGDVALSLAGLSASQADWTFAPSVVPGGAGTAQLTVTTAATIAPGSYPLTITGTSGTTTRTATATLLVAPPPDFGVTAMPSTLTVVAGTTGTATVGVSSLNGFTGTVALSLTGLPAAVGAAAFTPATVAAAGSAQLSISTLAGAPAGSYPLTVTGSSGGTSHSAALTLVVPAGDFGLSISPTSRTVTRGQSTTYAIAVSAVNGFVGNVSLSVTGKPSGSTATLSRNPVAAPGTSTLTLRTTTWTTRGTFTIRVTGSSGSLTHQAAATITIR
jgi:subtilisin family serine protease